MASRRGDQHQENNNPSNKNPSQSRTNLQSNSVSSSSLRDTQNEPYNRRTNYQHNSIPSRASRSSQNCLTSHSQENLNLQASMSAQDIDDTSKLRRRPKPLNAKDYKKSCDHIIP